jgi:hypothetical protein
VEEMLSELLVLLLPYAHRLDALNLSFRQKAVIARAACRHDDDNKAWDLIAALNKTRNELIHNLEPLKLKNVLKDLYSVHKQVDVIGVPVDRSQERLADDNQRLRWAIQDCMRFLANLISMTEKRG